MGETVTLHTHLVVRDDAHLLFAFATLPTGAWAFRPGEYLIIVAAFAPVLALMVAFGYWLVTGRLGNGSDGE